MKKSLLIIVICVLANLALAQSWVSLGSATPTEIMATVTESSSQTIRVLFSTQGFYSESINEGNVTYQWLSIPKASRSQAVALLTDRNKPYIQKFVVQ